MFVLFKLSRQLRPNIRYQINIEYQTCSFKDVRGWQFLTIEAAETLCMVCLPPEEHIFRKTYLGNWSFKKSHFVRVWPSNLYFYGSFKNCKMNFSQNSLGSTPSALLTWLKNYYIIDLKIELLGIKYEYYERFLYSRFFFGPINNKWFHSNLSVQNPSTLG